MSYPDRSQVAVRQRRILASLVGEYIEQGEPVSSTWLADHSPLRLSSATVRTKCSNPSERSSRSRNGTRNCGRSTLARLST